MASSNYNSSSVTRFLIKGLLTVCPGLVLLLVALSSVSYAATPWYSHGRAHTLTLTADGNVWALGGNDFGELGNGAFGGESHEPKKIGGLDNIIAVLAGGSHSVALKKDGTVWTWGANSSGQLGDGTTKGSPLPFKVAEIDNVKAIATGSGHIVALKHDGTVWAWGGNRSGQVGNGGYKDCLTPVQISGLQDISAISAGAFSTTALKKDGTVWSWGFNGKGQLGNGSKERSGTPVQVAGLADVHAIAAGDWHVVALKHDGTIWAWGSNHASQLGRMMTAISTTPLKVPGINNIIDITASVGHTIAIARNDTVWAWGDAGTGQWGNGLSLDGSVSPVQVSGFNGPVAVASVVNPDTILRDKPDGSSLLADAGSNQRSIADFRQSEVYITASR